MSAPKGNIVSGKAKVVNPVAEDANWRLNVGNELKSADIWNEDWGFLVHGGKYSHNIHIASDLNGYFV